MYKIKRIKFNHHPVLGDLELDFCDLSGKPVDTVIFAGENGFGKSTVLNTLYEAVTFTGKAELELTLDVNGIERVLSYQWKEFAGTRFIGLIDNDGLNANQSSTKVNTKYPFRGIYSDVDINFRGKQILYFWTRHFQNAQKLTRRRKVMLSERVNLRHKSNFSYSCLFSLPVKSNFCLRLSERISNETSIFFAK